MAGLAATASAATGGVPTSARRRQAETGDMESPFRGWSVRLEVQIGHGRTKTRFGRVAHTFVLMGICGRFVYLSAAAALRYADSQVEPSLEETEEARARLEEPLSPREFAAQVVTALLFV